MISDSQFVELDAEIWDLIGLESKALPRANTAEVDAALPDLAAEPDAEDQRRIERIIEKARFETVMKDSVGFLFKTMGSGLGELGAGVIAAAHGEARSAGATTPDKPPSPAADPDPNPDASAES